MDHIGFGGVDNGAVRGNKGPSHMVANPVYKLRMDYQAEMDAHTDEPQGYVTVEEENENQPGALGFASWAAQHEEGTLPGAFVLGDGTALGVSMAPDPLYTPMARHSPSEEPTHGGRHGSMAPFSSSVAGSGPPAPVVPKKNSWLCGQLTRDEAEARLTAAGRQPGTFLVRSKGRANSHVLSMIQPNAAALHHRLELSPAQGWTLTGRGLVPPEHGPLEALVARLMLTTENILLCRLKHPALSPV